MIFQMFLESLESFPVLSSYSTQMHLQANLPQVLHEADELLDLLDSVIENRAKKFKAGGFHSKLNIWAGTDEILSSCRDRVEQASDHFRGPLSLEVLVIVEFERFEEELTAAARDVVNHHQQYYTDWTLLYS